MRKKLISKLLTTSILTMASLSFLPTITEASTLQAPVTIQSKSVSEVLYTAYNWTVSNLGVNPRSTSQINGPMSGGCFNTESLFGSNRTFTIRWSGATSNASFYIRAVGADKGNTGSVNVSDDYCSGQSGSTTLTIPYSDRGLVKLYVVENGGKTISISSITVDSR